MYIYVFVKICTYQSTAFGPSAGARSQGHRLPHCGPHPPDVHAGSYPEVAYGYYPGVAFGCRLDAASGCCLDVACGCHPEKTSGCRLL